MKHKFGTCFVLFFLAWPVLPARFASAQEVKDSVKIYFRQGYSTLEPSLRVNQKSLDRIADSLRTSYADSVYRLKKIVVVGGASPEGSVAMNKRLSEKRAAVLFDYLSRYGSLPDSLKVTEFLGRDWRGLLHLAEADRGLPHREETLELLARIADESEAGIVPATDPLSRLQRLAGGVPYRYLYNNQFPELRASRLHLWYEKVRNPLLPDPPMKVTVTEEPVMQIPETATDTLPEVAVTDTVVPMVVPQPCKPFYMGLKTNLLYDALLVPNIGVEFYLGNHYSVAANWMYAWWKSDRKHNYWRTYGGDVEVRRWFGKRKPLSGHHLGVYGQIVTYDFELGHRGYLGDKWSYAGGIAYGYSHPIAHRLNLDFTLGVGYLGGKYKKYLPIDNCYVWQSTHQRHWFGPTKLEVSLVWLLGCDNYNRKKGGKQ